MIRFDVTVSCEYGSFHLLIEADNKAEAIRAAKSLTGPTYRDWNFAILHDSCPDC